MVGGYGELAFQFGLVDEIQKAFIDSQTNSAIASIQKKDFLAAFQVKRSQLSNIPFMSYSLVFLSRCLICF